MKTIISSDAERVEKAVMQICRLLDEKPDAVVAVSAGEDCLPLYAMLADLCAQGKACLSRARFFTVGEFEGLSEDDERSCQGMLYSSFGNADAAMDRFCFLTAENADSYDERIKAAGGLDLAILGVGINGRIGFNEPATPFDSRTHRQKLAPATRRELAGLFGSEEQVPEFGLTIGIKTIVEAREIIVTAAGESKAKAVFDMLYGRDDSTVPAAFLQLPPEVTIYLDESSASKL